MSYSRIKEHLQSRDKGLARKSSVPKVHTNPIHSSMSHRASTTLGGPPTGAPPDASSPRVTDPTRQCRTFPIPKITHGMKSDDVERGTYDPTRADKVMGEAATSPDDFAPKLHTLPATVSEE
jgi:hypothetical protein